MKEKLKNLFAFNQDTEPEEEFLDEDGTEISITEQEIDFDDEEDDIDAGSIADPRYEEQGPVILEHLEDKEDPQAEPESLRKEIAATLEESMEAPMEPELEVLPEIDMRGIIPEYDVQKKTDKPEDNENSKTAERPKDNAEKPTEDAVISVKENAGSEPLAVKISRWKKSAKRSFRRAKHGAGITFELIMERIAGVGPHMPQPQNEKEAHEMQLRAHKRLMQLRNGLIVFGVLTAVLIIRIIANNWHYSSYKIIYTRTQEDVLSTDYVELDGRVFKYSQETASLLDETGGLLWSGSYSIADPEIYVNGDVAVIYDKNGTDMSLFNSGGQIGNIHTNLPIIKAKISKKGYVAAILADGENTWINYYNTDGSEIATAKTRIDSPGYPMDLAVSESGTLMAVTYLTVENSRPSTRVIFYNFETTGQNQMDNQVSDYSYSGILAPQIEYLDGDKCVLIREDGFTVYEGGQIPKESERVDTDKQILSVFHNEKYIGMIFRSEESTARYMMAVYRLNGKCILEKDFNFPYADVEISGDQIVMNNSSRLCVITVDGVEKFNGSLEEGLVYDIFKIGSNRYLAVTEDGIHTIRLK